MHKGLHVDCCCLSGVGRRDNAIYLKALLSPAVAMVCMPVKSICKCTMNLILQNNFLELAQLQHGCVVKVIPMFGKDVPSVYCEAFVDSFHEVRKH